MVILAIYQFILFSVIFHYVTLKKIKRNYFYYNFPLNKWDSIICTVCLKAINLTVKTMHSCLFQQQFSSISFLVEISPLDMVPLFIFVFNIVKKIQISLCFSVEGGRVSKRSINNEWNNNKRSSPKEIRGEIRTLLWCMECNMIYFQEYFLFKTKTPDNRKIYSF